MNINKTAKAFAIAAVVGMSSQVFAATTNNWWNIDFQDATTITALTNTSYSTAGQWSTASGDESSIATGMVGETESVYLKLDTQGNDIKWTPTAPSTGAVVLVDSQVYLVGSDTAPTGFDTDPTNNPVQTAVYLKNYIDGNNTTTSSVLCAYVTVGVTGNQWVELAGVSMVDTNWYNLRIEVTYPGSSSTATARYIVNGTTLTQAGTSTESFTLANASQFIQATAQKVNSVSFRGTGSVDNFVGSQVLPDPAAVLAFDVTTFVNNVETNVAHIGDSGMTISAGNPWWYNFAETAEVEGSTNVYLSAIRVYTNETEYVEYLPTLVDGSWSLSDPLSYDEIYSSVRLTIQTAGLSVGYAVKAYYGSTPAAPAEKTVTFDANGGSGSMSAQSASTETALTANAFTKTGYAFGGWNTAANGSGTSYADQASYAFTEDATLYAQWTINQYTISFNSDGGSAVSSITQDYGTAVTAPADPTKTGYTFAGWSPEVPATMPVDGASLTAQWTINQYTITFNSDGGSAVSSITQDYGTAVTAPADPTKTGYTFAGWSPTVPTTMPVDGASLTAQWTINQYTITFNSDGGSAVSSITQDYGTAVTAPADPTKPGYTFAGWSPAVPATMPVGGASLTAQWTALPTEDVTFDTEGANLAITSMDIAGTIATVNFTANGTVNVVSPATATLWVIVSETLNGTPSYVEVEATASSASNAITGSFTVDLSTIPGTPDTLFVRGLRTDAPPVE